MHYLHVLTCRSCPHRPLLKTLDNLLVMGLLSDDDMHQLLFLIDPEIFDEGVARGVCFTGVA